MRYFKLLPLPLLMFGLNTTLHAEHAELPSITVTQSPSVLNVSILDSEYLKSLTSSTSDTASLLKNIPGLNIQGGGGVSGLPSIHGFADDRIRVKVDGMDLISACANHMNPALSYIDPTNVGVAMAFAGIAPVSMGGDSIGGTILVESEKPAFAEKGKTLLNGEIGTFYRSNGNARGGNISFTAANENVSLNYQASTTESDNYDAGSSFKSAGLAAAGQRWLDSDEVGSTEYKSTNQSLALAFRHENHQVGLKLGIQDIPYQSWANQRMDMTKNDSTQINLSYEGQYDWGHLESRIYSEHTRHEMQFGDDKLFWYAMPEGVPCTPSGMTMVGGKKVMGCAAGMPMETEGKNTGAMVHAEITPSARDLFRVGAEIQKYRLDDWWDPSGNGMWPDTFVNINNGERDRLALFGEWEAQWSPSWMTLIGLRGERVDMDTGEVQGYNDAKYLAEATAFNSADRSTTDHNIDATALARFTPSDTQDIEFGYARKTRSPNLYERYSWSTGGMVMRMINFAGDGNGYVGNLALDPEVAHTLSTTFDWHDANKAKWNFAVTPYYSYIDDYIDATRIDSASTATDEFVYLQFINQSAHMYGVDISGNMPLAESTRYGNFTASGIVNYVRGKNKTTGDNLYNIMPLNARLAVVQQLNNWTNTLEVELVDEKDRVSQERNELETTGYGLLHLRSSYKLKQVRIDFGVENVFDKFYYDPLGGAYMGQGKTMSGTDVAWGQAVPAIGRSIYAGLNFKF